MTMDVLNLAVKAVQAETPNIRSLVLGRPDGGALPGWGAGAHIDLHLPGGDTRSYSLINTSTEPAATVRPAAYRLGVRLDEASKGGSSFVHGLRPGDLVTASLPKNHFAVPEGEGETVLLAGGIGVTPIMSMAAELSARGRPYRMVYAGRSRAHLAFLEEIEGLCGGALAIHCDDNAGVYNLAALMESLPSPTPLCVCGPPPMIEGAIDKAKALGWAEGRLRFEIFSAPAPNGGDTAFEVVLAQSGKRVAVQADQSILDALVAAGEAPMSDCKRGECGICQAGVLEGTPDHRDYYLSEKERSSNTVIQICVSRSKTRVLVLDL